MLGFAFHLGKRIARREKVRVQLVAAVGGGKLGRRPLFAVLECAAHQIAASPDMSASQGRTTIAKVHIGHGLENASVRVLRTRSQAEPGRSGYAS